jgi:hypothetical protein
MKLKNGKEIEWAGRKLQELWQDIMDSFGEAGVEVDEYFSIDCACITPLTDMFPERPRWVCVYAVEGGSEGHYIHVETIDSHHVRHIWFLGKTFQGLDHALKMANHLTRIFYDDGQAVPKTENAVVEELTKWVKVKREQQEWPETTEPDKLVLEIESRQVEACINLLKRMG